LARVYQELLGADDEALLTLGRCPQEQARRPLHLLHERPDSGEEGAKVTCIEAYRQAADYIATANLKLARLLEQIPENANALKFLHKFLTFKDIREGGPQGSRSCDREDREKETARPGHPSSLIATSRIKLATMILTWTLPNAAFCKA